MRTTIDLPDSLMERAQRKIAGQKTTFRALVIGALEKVLGEEDSVAFKLRDASVGVDRTDRVSSDEINRAIDEQREGGFRP